MSWWRQLNLREDDGTCTGIPHIHNIQRSVLHPVLYSHGQHHLLPGLLRGYTPNQRFFCFFKVAGEYNVPALCTVVRHRLRWVTASSSGLGRGEAERDGLVQPGEEMAKRGFHPCLQGPGSAPWGPAQFKKNGQELMPSKIHLNRRQNFFPVQWVSAGEIPERVWETLQTHLDTLPSQVLCVGPAGAGRLDQMVPLWSLPAWVIPWLWGTGCALGSGAIAISAFLILAFRKYIKIPVPGLLSAMMTPWALHSAVTPAANTNLVTKPSDSLRHPTQYSVKPNYFSF